MILPKISGPEVLASLKKDAATAGIPVVVLSGLTGKNRQKVVEAGAEDYVKKNSLIPLPGVNVLPEILEILETLVQLDQLEQDQRVPLEILELPEQLEVPDQQVQREWE